MSHQRLRTALRHGAVVTCAIGAGLLGAAPSQAAATFSQPELIQPPSPYVIDGKVDGVRVAVNNVGGAAVIWNQDSGSLGGNADGTTATGTSGRYLMVAVKKPGATTTDTAPIGFDKAAIIGRRSVDDYPKGGSIYDVSNFATVIQQDAAGGVTVAWSNEMGAHDGGAGGEIWTRYRAPDGFWEPAQLLGFYSAYANNGAGPTDENGNWRPFRGYYNADGSARIDTRAQQEFPAQYKIRFERKTGESAFRIQRKPPTRVYDRPLPATEAVSASGVGLKVAVPATGDQITAQARPSATAPYGDLQTVIDTATVPALGYAQPTVAIDKTNKGIVGWVQAYDYSPDGTTHRTRYRVGVNAFDAGPPPAPTTKVDVRPWLWAPVQADGNTLVRSVSLYDTKVGDQVKVTCTGTGCDATANREFTINPATSPLVTAFGEGGNGILLQPGAVLSVTTTRSGFLPQTVKWTIVKGAAPKKS